MAKECYVHVEPEPTEEERYGLYYREPSGELHRVAETDLDGVGRTILQLADDRRECGLSPTEIIGVLDRIERRWLCGIWEGGP